MPTAASAGAQQPALTSDDRERIRGAAWAITDAENQLRPLERRLRESIADAHPDPPAPGEKPERGPQQQLSALTGWSGTYLRRVRTQIRTEREKTGNPLRTHDRAAAVSALKSVLPQVRHLRTQKTGHLQDLADAVETAVPYTGTRQHGADGHFKDEGIRKTLYTELRELTGYSTRQLDRMRHDAAQRREETHHQLGHSHREINGGFTPSFLAPPE